MLINPDDAIYYIPKSELKWGSENNEVVKLTWSQIHLILQLFLSLDVYMSLSTYQKQPWKVGGIGCTASQILIHAAESVTKVCITAKQKPVTDI